MFWLITWTNVKNYIYYENIRFPCRIKYYFDHSQLFITDIDQVKDENYVK